MEAIVKGQKERPDNFPKIITCPNEMVAMSMADVSCNHEAVTSYVSDIILNFLFVCLGIRKSDRSAAMRNHSCRRRDVWFGSCNA